MLLSVFTRHSADCKFARDRNCRRCNCPKWVGGQVNGYYFRQSAKTRQWAEAEACRLNLEEALTKGLPPFGHASSSHHSIGVSPVPSPAPAPQAPLQPTESRIAPRPRVTVAKAVDAYLSDAVSRSVESSTLKKIETIFRKQFLVWTRAQGIEYLDELDLDALLNFRGTWKDGALAKQKKQSRVIGFFWACDADTSPKTPRSGWEGSKSFRFPPTTFLPMSSRGSSPPAGDSIKGSSEPMT